MKYLNRFVLLIAVLTVPCLVRAEGQSDAASVAKKIAPYVDDMTVAVAHVDLSRVAVRPLMEALARLMPEAKEEMGHDEEELNILIGRFTHAGGKDIYFTVSFGNAGPLPAARAIIPLSASADEKEICAALKIPAEAGLRVGDALVLRLPPMDNRRLEIKASQRPELTAAFEAAGDGAAQAVLIPPAYTRRVIAELMPKLPKEIGGGPSGILTQGVTWAAVGIDLPPHPALHAVVKSNDAAAAEALRGKWAEILRLGGQCEEIRKIVPSLDQVAPLLTPKVDGDRLLLTLDSTTPEVEKLVAAAESALQKAQGGARRTQSMNNVKQIALAMCNYCSTFNNHFPAAASSSPDGKPLLSWRVYILPFIEEDALYKQFHLNEPWDSPHNKTLIDKMPRIYAAPKSKAEKGKTNYLVPVGNGALYTTSGDEPKIQDIKDGTSQTIMIAEVDDQHAVTWTKPHDFAFDPKDPRKGIGNLYEGGFNAAYCDGSVRFLSDGIPVKTLSALFTRAGGEVIGQY